MRYKFRMSWSEFGVNQTSRTIKEGIEKMYSSSNKIK